MGRLRVLLNLAFTAVFLVCIAIIVQASNTTTLTSASTDMPTGTPTITPIPTKIQEAPPVKIEIPDLGVNTNVQSVGQASEGEMGVPDNFTDVAWYNLGPKPGEEGNSIIDGHYDTETGAPAVFYYLQTLHPGSEIIVTTQTGKVLKFVVTQVTSYPSDNFPFDIVAGDTDQKHLNLITCGGVWNRYLHNYSERAVVFSQLEN